MPTKKRKRQTGGNATRVRDLYSSGQSLRSIAEVTGIAEARVSEIVKEHSSAAKRSTRKIAPRAVANAGSTNLLNFLQYLKPLCWTWKLRMFKQILEKFMEDTDSTLIFSQTWRTEFSKKHEKILPTRIFELLNLKTSKESTKPVTTEEVFETVEDLYKKLGIEEMPQCIWTFEGVDVELPEPPKKKKREMDPSVPLFSENSPPEYASALCAASANGDFTPGTLLFKGVRTAAEWKTSLPLSDREKIVLLVNNSGKCDFQAMTRWLKTVFMKKIVSRPIVLFIDGAFGLADNYEFIKLAFEDEIFLVSLPSKLQNIKTPFGVKFRAIFRDKWYEGLDDLQLNVSPTAPLIRSQVVETFLPAFQTLTSEVVKEGFRDCGFYPLNPNATPNEKKELTAESMGVSMGGFVGGSDEEMIEITLAPPLSPETQEAVDEAMEVFARAGVSESKARKLLRNMNVPGFGSG